MTPEQKELLAKIEQRIAAGQAKLHETPTPSVIPEDESAITNHIRSRTIE